jgi:uncharacterized coiled-coil protein SlyX
MSFLNRFRSKSTTSAPTPQQQPQQQQQQQGAQKSDGAGGTSSSVAPSRIVAATAPPSTTSTQRHQDPDLSRQSTERNSLSHDDELGTLRLQLQLREREAEQHTQHCSDLSLEIQQLRETVQQLMDDLGSRDRAMKRNESLAKETLRAKERQVVQQSTQLSEVQAKLLQLQDAMGERDTQLLRQQQRLASVEGRAVDGQEEQSAYQLQSQRALQQRDDLIASLQRSVADFRTKCEELQKKQHASEEKVIRLDFEIQTRDATIASLRDSIDGARRISLLRSGSSGSAMELASPLGTGGGNVTSPAAVLNRELSNSTPTTGGAAVGEEENDSLVVVASLDASSSIGDPPTNATDDPEASARRMREALGLEHMLRAKDKQVIRLSNEVVSLRAELSSKQLALEQLKHDKNMSDATSASAVSAMETLKIRVDEMAQEAVKRNQQLADIRTQKHRRDEELDCLRDQYAELLREADELRAQQDAYRSFRVQHMDCQARIVDKDLALFQNSTALSECRSLLDRAYGDIEQLNQQLGKAKKECSTITDESSVRMARSDARIGALEVQLAERKRCIHELEESIANKTDLYDQLSAEMTSLRALREEEREAWRNKTQQSQDALQQLQQSLHRTADQHQFREKQLLDQIEKLQSENNIVLQSKREQEAHVLHLTEQLRREQNDKIITPSASSSVSRTAATSAGSGASTRASLAIIPSPDVASIRSSGSEKVGTTPQPSPLHITNEIAEVASTAQGSAAGGSNTAASPTTRNGGQFSNTTSLQRVSLELEETRQKYNRLQRDYASREREIENLIRRLQEAEASSGGDGTTSTSSERRRLAGIFESLSVELCHQLANHLRFDYMRNGASLTLPAVMNSFHLGKEEASEMMDALSRTMLMVRLHVHLPHICSRLGVKESSVRRVVHAFARSGVQAPEDESSRRRRLLETTPADARYTYSGHERLVFLFCAARRPKNYQSGTPFRIPPKSSSSSSVDGEDDDLEDEVEDGSTEQPKNHQKACPIRRLGSDRFLLGLVCSYLPVVLRGSTAFAAHVMHHPNSGNASGQTLLVSLEPTSSSFTLMECEVSASGKTMAVLLSGTYRSGFSWQSCNHVKVSLSCRTKQDGQWIPTGDGNGKWEWSSMAKLSREESAEAVQYTIKRGDGVFDGLVAETKGVRLRELSVEEVMLIQELYSGELTADEMMHHASWDRIPSPSSGRKKSSSSSSAAAPPAAAASAQKR